MHYLLAQASDVYTTTSSNYTCTINGEPAPCEDVGKIAAAILIPFLLIFAVLTVFWVISLIHVIKHEDVPNRTVWIILHFVGLGPLTGIIYFFVVKRPYDKSHTGGVNNPVPPTPTNPTVSPQPPTPPVQPVS